MGFFITPQVKASVGYYYQSGDLGSADGSDVLGRLVYEMSSGFIAGVNISYDEAFETRVSADLKVRFGGASTTAQRKEVQQLPVISALTSTPSNRDVRVHDRFDKVICFAETIRIPGKKDNEIFVCGDNSVFPVNDPNTCGGRSNIVGAKGDAVLVTPGQGRKKRSIVISKGPNNFLDKYEVGAACRGSNFRSPGPIIKAKNLVI